jgi:DNA-directed RNA polymerase specialized sigma24 family protein
MDLEKLEYEKLSDNELIQLFCCDPPDRDAFDVLWKRYEPKIKSFARNLTRMCPSSSSREIFHDEVFSKMQERILTQVCGYERRIPFSAWLWMLGQCVAIDERRKILGKGHGIPRTFIPLTEEELARSGALFRDKVKEDPIRTVLERERDVLLKQIFKQYAGTQEGFESLSTVYLCFQEGRTVKEIATHYCTYREKISRMRDHDCEALQALFAEKGIESLRDILTD